MPYIDGLMQERRNSIANAWELRLSCINPSIYDILIRYICIEIYMFWLRNENCLRTHYIYIYVCLFIIYISLTARNLRGACHDNTEPPAFGAVLSTSISKPIHNPLLTLNCLLKYLSEHWGTGSRLNMKTVFPCVGIPFIKIKLSDLYCGNSYSVNDNMTSLLRTGPLNYICEFFRPLLTKQKFHHDECTTNNVGAHRGYSENNYRPKYLYCGLYQLT